MTGDQGYYEQLCEIISSHSDLFDKAEALEGWVRFEYDGEYSSTWADLINNSQVFDSGVVTNQSLN